MKPVDVVGVRVEMPTNQPIVLLREREGERYLPIWIGAVEATAIAYAQQGVEPARPLTHDLLADVVAGLGHELVEVRQERVYAGVRRLAGRSGGGRRQGDDVIRPGVGHAGKAERCQNRSRSAVGHAPQNMTVALIHASKSFEPLTLKRCPGSLIDLR
jgi:hypothetical protein